MKYKYIVIWLLLICSPLNATYLKGSLTVKFVTEANYFPFEYLNKSGEIVGFDIDIANAICEATNLKCTFKNQSFNTLLLGLEFGQFDAAISAIDITQTRKQRVDFSDVYFKTSPVFIGPSTGNGFATKGKLVGVAGNSSNYEYLLKKMSKDTFVVPYPSLSKAFSDLEIGELDYVFSDAELANNFLKMDKNDTLFKEVKVSKSYFSIGYGIAVKQENYRLLNRIDLGLKIIKGNGKYKKIVDQYFK